MNDTLYELTTAELLSDATTHDLAKAPPRLFCRGDVSLLQGTSRVSIIGSRDASPEGLKRSTRLSRLISGYGLVVVSGLAKGVDTAAHVAAMNHGGRTIAVIGTAIDRCYPSENRYIQNRIATEHLLVSQFAPGSQTTPTSFTSRNRTMALLSHATVVVEASETSGTVHQCRETARLNRPLFFLRSLAESRVSWVRQMIRDGAGVLGNDNVHDLLGLFPGFGPITCDECGDQHPGGPEYCGKPF